MSFASLSFILFFVIVVAAYFYAPRRCQWQILLVASSLFYAAFLPRYLPLLFFLIAVDYYLALRIEVSSGESKRWYLLASILSGIGMLVVFKYFDFIGSSVNQFAYFIGWNYSLPALHLILPLGLSFHVFQSLAYVIEVYRGKQRAERHFGFYALYVMFFPQLVAGPIERPQHLLPQLRQEHEFDEPRVIDGLSVMLIGYFKKLVIADQLAVFVDKTFNGLNQANGVTLLLAVIGFGFQVYYDFSGYSDIAVGSAKVLGIHLSQNFNRPYFSSSISEFWRRWHVSLYSWFRDYVFYPLAFGMGTSRARLYVALLLTFGLSGLWHGANWTFLAWGLLHGVYLTSDMVTKRWRAKVTGIIAATRLSNLVTVSGMLVTFVLVSFGWIFFRAASLADSFHIIRVIISDRARFMDIGFLRYHVFTDAVLGMTRAQLAAVLLSIGIMEVIQHTQSAVGLYAAMLRRPRALRYAVYYGIAFWGIFFARFGQAPFIYFQF